MGDLLIEVQGNDAIAETKELLAILGMTGMWSTGALQEDFQGVFTNSGGNSCKAVIFWP